MIATVVVLSSLVQEKYSAQVRGSCLAHCCEIDCMLGFSSCSEI